MSPIACLFPNVLSPTPGLANDLHSSSVVFGNNAGRFFNQLNFHSGRQESLGAKASAWCYGNFFVLNPGKQHWKKKSKVIIMNQRSLQNVSLERHKEKNLQACHSETSGARDDGWWWGHSLSMVKCTQLPEASKKRNVSAMVQRSCQRLEICQVGSSFWRYLGWSGKFPGKGLWNLAGSTWFLHWEADLPQGAKRAAAAPASLSSLRRVPEVLLFTTAQGPHCL